MCVFCEIAAGRLPARVLRETEKTIVFLDANPAAPGHALAVPKGHFENLLDCPDLILAELIAEAKAVGGLLKERLGADGFNVLNANGRAAQQTVFHLHLHVVPRYDGDSLNLWFHGRIGDGAAAQESAFDKLKGVGL